MKPHRGRAQSAATLVATTVMGVALTLFAAPAAHAQKAPATAQEVWG